MTKDVPETARLTSSYWVRDVEAAGVAVGDGLSCIGAAVADAAADCGGGGTGSGQIGSVAAEPGDAAWTGAGVGGLPACFRTRCDVEEGAACGLGLDAAAAATPGKTGPDGSGFMMLTAGIEAAVGKSIFTGLCAACVVD